MAAGATHVGKQDHHLTQFIQFGLANPILKALAMNQYTEPTPIQAQAIPLVMEGRDLLGLAQTGTGKTAVFALPIIHRLSKAGAKRHPRSARALVLSPTRELAGQIARSFKTYGQWMHLSVGVVFGGVSINPQINLLQRGVDVLVSTPGRLLDLVERKALDLSTLDILVLDEADQMLDLGFIHDLRRIVKLLPKQRQSLFFSATMPKNIEELADQFLSDPVRVQVTPPASTVERIDQRVIFVSGGRKQDLLAQMLANPEVTRAIVFTRTKHGADKVMRGLVKSGIDAAAIHGNKSHNQRETALGQFKSGQCRVLIATDVASRGIDVDGISHVFNYELPNVPESYVHRIGRTARAGAEGIAISFCNREERAYLRDIERLTRVSVQPMDAPKGFDVGSDQPDSRAAPSGKAAPHRRGPPPRGHAHDKEPRHGKARPHGSGERHKPGRNEHRKAEHHAEGRPQRADGKFQRDDRASAPRGDKRNGAKRPFRASRPR